jgi:hypothetical protein
VHLLSHFGRSFHRPRSEALSYSETLGNAKHDSRADCEPVSNSHRDTETVGHSKRHAISYSHRCSQPISHRDRREFTLPFANKLRADREFAGDPTEKL